MKIYIIGATDELKALFPEKDWDHQRLSHDGLQAVVDVEMDEDAAYLFASDNPGLQVMDHAEALAYLNATDKIGVWRDDDPEPVAPPAEDLAPPVEPASEEV